MRKILYALILATLPTVISAQTVVGDRFRLNTGPCILRSGSGSPEGVLVGNVCDMYINTATGVWYTKWTGTGNTGWGVGHNAAARVNGNLDVTGFVEVPGYVSQLTGWQVSAAGAADFRYIYTDELHAKAFIADLEQALAGGQIICKSVTSLGANFTVPTTAGTATLTVKDLPSAANVAVFQANDWVGVRTFSRAGGGLTIGDAFGVVTAYADQPNGLQTWTFTRGTGANGGGLATSTVINSDSIVIDYGVSGNGCHEVNAIDGVNSVNSPYTQTWTWTTSPISANRTIRTRVGNLVGMTSTAGEYGFIGGTFNATLGLNHYIKASNNGLVILGGDLQIYDGATLAFHIEPTIPYLSLGSAAPTTYGTGTGVWMGKDSGVYKWRVGNPAGNRVTWDGTTLSVVGDGGGVTNINGANIQTGTVSAAKLTVGSGLNLIRNADCMATTDDWTFFTNSGLTPSLATSLPSWSLNNAGGTCYLTTLTTPAAGTETQGFGPLIPIIAGNKYEASVYFGVHRAGNTQIGILWRDNTNAVTGTVTYSSACTAANAGGLQLNGYCRTGVITTAPVGAVSAQLILDQLHTGGAGGANPYMFWVHAFLGEALVNQTELTPWGPAGVTEIIGGMIKTNTITATNIAAATITATQIAANTITAAKIAAGTITATEIAAATITGAKIVAATISGANIAANTITAGNIAANTITATQIAASTITATQIDTTTITALNLTSGTISIGGVFSVNGAGLLTSGNAIFNNLASFTNAASTVGFSGNITVNGTAAITSLAGGGARHLCISNVGLVYAGPTLTTC